MDKINEKHMRDYLINFCHDEYERIEMQKWIKKTSIKFVYEFITKHFKTSSNSMH